LSGSPSIPAPAVFRDIGSIASEDAGRRVRVMGFVVNIQDPAVAVISDDTGSITITTTAECSLHLQDFIRVIGTVTLSGEGKPLIRAEIIQDVSRLDKHLYRQAMRLLSRVVSSGRTG